MTVEELHAVAKERYWKDKDLSAARASLERGIALARTQERPDLEKPLQYDLASFCWPGWNEPGVRIGEEEVSDGERAANENLRLAGILNVGGRGMANAWFMIGAYQLVAALYVGAYRSFRRQEANAASVEDRPGIVLAQGYASLARGIGLKGEVKTMLPAVERLRTSDWEQGEAFAVQLETAARVFGR